MSPLSFFRKIPTSLEINGPILSFVDNQPSSVSVCNGGSAVFTSGIVTATFPTQSPPNPAQNTGTIAYRWYEVGIGALSDGANITGTATTVLTLSNLSSPSDNNRQFFIRADYVPSAYAIGKSTGNAINEFLDSEVVGITVYPSISITSQPSSQTVAQTIPATFSVTATTTDPTQGSLSYQWTSNGSDLSDNSLVSGSRSTDLRIASNTVGTQSIQCRVSHPTACNSPILTTPANLIVVPARAILQWNRRLDGATQFNQFGNGSHNLFTDGALTFDAYEPRTAALVELWAPESDVRVRVTIAGAAGLNGYGVGGEGGVSVVEFTIQKETEFITKIGSYSPPTGGNNGGGGSTVLYKKAKSFLIAGGGGANGSRGRGGRGGGIGVAGENGTGGNGSGARSVSDGSLPTVGYFPYRRGTSPTAYDGPYFGSDYRLGGRISACPLGGGAPNSADYWKSRYSPCDDLGFTTYVNLDGNRVSGTPALHRGYKPGLGHRNNGGNGGGTEGGAGAGAFGGDAADPGTGGGGGGGSGYSSGEVSIISTQLGGNPNPRGYIKFELVL